MSQSTSAGGQVTKLETGWKTGRGERFWGQGADRDSAQNLHNQLECNLVYSEQKKAGKGKEFDNVGDSKEESLLTFLRTFKTFPKPPLPMTARDSKSSTDTSSTTTDS